MAHDVAGVAGQPLHGGAVEAGAGGLPGLHGRPGHVGGGGAPIGHVQGQGVIAGGRALGTLAEPRPTIGEPNLGGDNFSQYSNHLYMCDCQTKEWVMSQAS